MKRHWTVVLALVACAVSCVSTRDASAQRIANHYYQNMPAGSPRAQGGPSPQPYAEELPPGSPNDTEGPFRDDQVPNGFIEYGPHSGVGDELAYGACGDPMIGCSDECCESSANCAPCCVDCPSQWYFRVDYIHARANFSESTAFVQQVEENGIGETTLYPLSFDYDSSYRIGGGYRLCDCGEEIRFLYTRLSSSAETDLTSEDPSVTFFVYGTAVVPDGAASIEADVDLDTFDVEFAKTIPLGGNMCGGCGDACSGGGQCGDACGSSCPAWDITWSGGLRLANAEWDRSYVVFDETEFATNETDVDMNFRGGGVRMGLEGRRYFFPTGWLSLYMKGDISLLLGDVEITSDLTVNDPTTPNDPVSVDTQSIESREIIPVTEIETGLSIQATCHSAFSAGYMFSAWHDLGFRDEPGCNPDVVPNHYDDANILGFDGFFARWEWAY